MAKETGTSGRIKVGATTIDVAGWEAVTTSNNQEVNETNDYGTKSRIAGLKDISGSVRIWIRPDTLAAFDLLEDGVIASLELHYKTGVVAYGPFSAIFDNRRVRNNVGSPMEGSVDFALADGPIYPS